MSGLRDARLRKALESAPDAQLRPAEHVRRNILAKARDAVAPARPRSGWQRLWHSSGTPRAPWNAAFATIALATLVTVLWHDREVPEARPDAVTAGSPAEAPPAAVPAPAASVAAAAPPLAPPAPVAESRRARKPAAPTRPQGGVGQDAAPAREPLRDAPLQRRDESAAQPAEHPHALAKSAAPQAEKSRAAGVATAPPAAPATRMAAQRQPSPVDEVTRLRVTGPGRAAEVALEHPSRLADLLARTVRGARSLEALESPVDTRIEMRGQGQLTGVLELAGPQVRWTASQAGAEAAAVTARPDAALLQALREELGRLAR